MDEYGFTPRYLTRNGQPWFPVMGEFHYSRYPAEYWKESLFKMKAGGVDIVSSYVIWIHHEEAEGEYDFSGNRDLGRFVRSCGECGLTMMLRIGPWSHAEVRNGGFPDWLLKKPFAARTNDPEYFRAVEKFYRAIFERVKGLFLKDLLPDGNQGPIIGVQIENEFGHCGGLSGKEGEEHMRRLASMAREIGFNAPLYTATGWGGAVTGGLLPVMGGYCEAPWDQRLGEIEPSGNYVITHERNDHNIGSDYGFGHGITFDLEKFPYLTAELGGGLQVTKHRRPVASARDIGAMSLVKLASGVNLLGYYLYHGGSNPKGKFSTLQESKATGSLNDLPELSYDFRAPIREYGQLSETYRELKLLALFLHDFGSALCRMPETIPESNPLKPVDFSGIRHSFRSDGNSGFLFINNYQRRRTMASHAAVSFRAPDGRAFPPIDIEDGDSFFLPFNMAVGDATLETALVTPLCVLRKDPPVYVFYAAYAQAEKLLASGKTDELYQFKDGKKPDDAEIRTLSRRDALDTWKIGEELIIERGEVLAEGRSISIHERVTGPIPAVKAISTDELKAVFSIFVPVWNAEDCFLRIAYEGDSARLYENGLLIADNFFVGPEYTWEIGLKRFGHGKAHEFRLEIDALKADAAVFLESWPRMESGKACRLKDASCELQIRKGRVKKG
jgi:beta-galactosidase